MSWLNQLQLHKISMRGCILVSFLPLIGIDDERDSVDIALVVQSHLLSAMQIWCQPSEQSGVLISARRATRLKGFAALRQFLRRATKTRRRRAPPHKQHIEPEPMCCVAFYVYVFFFTLFMLWYWHQISNGKIFP
jgi:hypothetical protein